MRYTDNPIDDFNRWDREQERRRGQLPRCDVCGEHIQQDDAVFLGNEWYCDDCLYKARTAIEID